MARKRRIVAIVIAAAVLLVLAPQIRDWLTSYEGVVLRTDTETVSYSSKKGARARRAKVYKIEIGTAEGEPFWVTVEHELYQQIKIGSLVSKGLFRNSPEIVTRPEGLAELKARYPWAGRKAAPRPDKEPEPEDDEPDAP